MGSPMDMDSLKQDLSTSAMKGEWAKVLEIYNKNPCAHSAKITRAGDTALHIAVSDAREDVVEQLVTIITAAQNTAALGIQRAEGNTPLHLAASLGNATMCYCIARARSSLVGSRNCDGETPLFMAAYAGKKEAFLCLHSFSGVDGYSHGTRNDHETVLHSAIAGDHFDLAFQIIQLYERFVNSVNKHGLSPLHILASKPNAFRSGIHLGRWKQFIYHCIFVDPLKPDPRFDVDQPRFKRSEMKETKTSLSFPENYTTCFHFLHLLKKLVLLAFQGGSDHRDTEKGIKAKSESACQDFDPDSGHEFLPPNYITCFNFIKLVSKALLVILGLGSRGIIKLREKKEKHTWSVQVMKELLYRYDYDGSMSLTDDRDTEGERRESNDIARLRETPILIAAKSGITEIVDKILDGFPMAAHDENEKKKNLVLLAVENRQPQVYELLRKKSIVKESEFRAIDSDGNSALHLAAMLGDHKPWLIPGAALQMQWEIKWYEFVKNSMPLHFFNRYNKNGKTPRDIFTENHKDLVQKGGEWLTNTSESCSVVAALIATVAFATSTALPGGINENSGKPIFENHPAFEVFAVSSLVALCFSITSVIMFLAVLTSRYQEKDFEKDLPRKLLFGMTCLLVSIAAILVSFCAGHFFVMKDKLKYAALPVYAVMCLPVTLFAAAQFPLYFDLVWAFFRKVPKRSYTVVSL